MPPPSSRRPDQGSGRRPRRVPGQLFKARRKERAILWRQSGATMMRQPYFHAAEHIEQKSHALPDMIPGLAQPRIADRTGYTLGLRERFARMRQDIALLILFGASQPQINDARQ